MTDYLENEAAKDAWRSLVGAAQDAAQDGDPMDTDELAILWASQRIAKLEGDLEEVKQQFIFMLKITEVKRRDQISLFEM